MKNSVFPKAIIPLKYKMVTSYLLPCDGGYLQIDTGYPSDYKSYRKKLNEAEIDISEIRYILLTHHHDDHAGFLNEIAKDSDIQLIAHEYSIDLLESGENDKTRGGGYVSGIVSMLANIKMKIDRSWTLSFPPFKVRSTDIIISGDNNSLLRQLGVPGKIIYTPGHCIDHIALVLDNGDTFCGDAAANMLLWAGTKYCTVFMTDMDAAYNSWDHLLSNGAKRIIPAHGNPFSSEKLKEHRGQILTKELVKFF